MQHSIPYVFNKSEIINQFENDKQYENWLAKMLHAKKIVQVRKGQYALLDINGFVLSNKFEIATKISADSFVAYHSALEYYGVANQVFNDVYVGSSARFNGFTFNDIEYICRIVPEVTQVLNIVNASVRVTSLERTIIDCIDKLELAGGIEEVLNALEQTRVLDESKLLAVLQMYSKTFLYQKTGYILEHFQKMLSLSNDFFEVCKKQIKNKTYYFLQDEYKNISFNSKWLLMAPTDLTKRIHGGL